MILCIQLHPSRTFSVLLLNRRVIAYDRRPQQQQFIQRRYRFRKQYIYDWNGGSGEVTTSTEDAGMYHTSSQNTQDSI